MPVGGACFYARTPDHTHPAYMFVLNFNDQTSMKIDGAIVTGLPGSVSALSPNIQHQELHSDDPPHYIGMFIHRQFFEKQYRLYSRGKLPRFRGESYVPDKGLLPLLKRFMIEADNKQIGTDAILEALGVEICHSLIRSVINVHASRDRLTEKVELNRVIEYLHSHMDDKITVDVLASVAHLSASHFARVFKEETGKAPMEYVHNFRLERAKKLLLAGDKSITEIAMECGFNNPSYLSACFQKQYRITPSEYRRSANTA
jgi:AraC family transcriptional regulator